LQQQITEKIGNITTTW